MACVHEWIGKADGVTCVKCGKHMFPEEFADYLAKSKKPEKKPKPKKGT